MSDISKLEKRKQNILIVDDNNETCNLLKTILEINNFNCFLCYNGVEALKFLENNSIDLILMDIMMPVIDGLEASKKILANKNLKNIPIIIITAKEDEELIKKSFNFGIKDYITKPFKNLELVSRIEKVLLENEEKYNLVKKKKLLKITNKKIKKKSNILKKQNKNLKYIDKLKDDFITCMTHDLKNPITSIKGLADLILNEKKLSTEKKEEFLKNIIKQTDNLYELINNLLQNFKKSSNIMNLNLEKIYIDDLIDDIINSFKTVTEEKNLFFNVTREIKIKHIWCDYIRIKELLSNLINNSIKFTKKGGIYFKITNNDDFIFFEVEDTGIGISSEDLPNIFNKFYRSKNISSCEGTGLGLFIALKIAYAHRGDIIVKSKLNEGSKFIFIMPIAEFN